MIIRIHNGELDVPSQKCIERIKDDEMYFKRIEKWRARSAPQMSKYWSYWIKTYSQHTHYDKYIIHKHGAIIFDQVHRMLALQWAFEMQRTDLIKEETALVDGKPKTVGIVRLNFADCTQRDFNSFIEWLHDSFYKLTKFSLDEAGYDNE